MPDEPEPQTDDELAASVKDAIRKLTGEPPPPPAPTPDTPAPVPPADRPET